MIRPAFPGKGKPFPGFCIERSLCRGQVLESLAALHRLFLGCAGSGCTPARKSVFRLFCCLLAFLLRFRRSPCLSGRFRLPAGMAAAVPGPGHPLRRCALGQCQRQLLPRPMQCPGRVSPDGPGDAGQSRQNGGNCADCAGRAVQLAADPIPFCRVRRYCPLFASAAGAISE